MTAHSHTAGQGQNQGLNGGTLAPELTVSTTVLHIISESRQTPLHLSGAKVEAQKVK